jgi:hypothetical protein
MSTTIPLPPLSSASRLVYAQSYRRTGIFQDRISGCFSIQGNPGEQFASLSLCEDEIDRRMDAAALPSRRASLL